MSTTNVRYPPPLTRFSAGDVIHIWWHDRQGAIQTNGFHILKNFSLFLLLLLALDHLPPEGLPGVHDEDAKPPAEMEVHEGPETVSLKEAVSPSGPASQDSGVGDAALLKVEPQPTSEPASRPQKRATKKTAAPATEVASSPAEAETSAGEESSPEPVTEVDDIPTTPTKLVYKMTCGLELELQTEIASQYGIIGRGTKVCDIKIIPPPPGPASMTTPSPELPEDAADHPIADATEAPGASEDIEMTPVEAPSFSLVAKVAHIHEDRRPEDEIIAEALYRAHEYGEGDKQEVQDAIFGHVPEVVAAEDYKERSTKNIREALNLKGTSKKESRITRIIVFRKLKPITEVPKRYFWRVFWDCVYCEFRRHRRVVAEPDGLPQVIGRCGNLGYIIATSASTT